MKQIKQQTFHPFSNGFDNTVPVSMVHTNSERSKVGSPPKSGFYTQKHLKTENQVVAQHQTTSFADTEAKTNIRNHRAHNSHPLAFLAKTAVLQSNQDLAQMKSSKNKGLIFSLPEQTQPTLPDG